MRNKRALLTAMGALFVITLSLAAYHEAPAHSGEVRFTRGGAEISSTPCDGPAYTFEVTNHTNVWITQTREKGDGYVIQNYDGQMTVPLQWTPACQRDEGVYQTTAYELANGAKGAEIGSASFSITWVSNYEFPPLPEIGSIEIGGGSTSGFVGLQANANRATMGLSLNILIKDSKGNPYPDYVSSKSGKVTAPVTLGWGMVRGDKVGCVSGLAFCAMGYSNLSGGKTAIGVWTIPGNKGENPNLVIGAPIPGPVTLKSVWAQAWYFWRTEPCFTDVAQTIPCGPNDFNNQQQAWSPIFETDTKLWTVADPPQISSITPTAAKANQTITITGKNFDSSGAVMGWQWGNRIYFDLDRKELTSSRMINDWSGTENYVHYCTPTKLKFEVPPDVAPGNHTVTIFNEFWYSNSIPIEVQSGQGTPEEDPACFGLGGIITSISPTSGPVGTRVTIKGTGFGVGSSADANVVKFNGVRATVFGTELDGKQLVVQVPSGAITGRVTVKPAGKFEIVGPVFTVTGTTGGGEGGGEGEEGGGGGDGGEEEFVAESNVTIQTITPDVLYIGSDNVVILEGSGFTAEDTFIAEPPVMTFSNVEVSDDGKVLRVDIHVDGAAPAGPAQFILISGAGSPETDFAQVIVDLAVKNPGAPEISSATAYPTNVAGQVILVLTGRNFTPDSVVTLVGLPTASLSSFEIVSEGEIQANVEEFGFDISNPLGFLIKRAFAQTGKNSPGAATVNNKNGQAAIAVNAEKLRVAAERPNEITLPEVKPTGFEGICSKGIPLAKCIQGIYLLSLGLGSIVSLLMIILAGYRYMTAQGNAQQVEKAKEAFAAAFIGLVIIFVAFILLYLINPDLVQFRDIGFGR